jgi:hypothetical protein
LENAIMNIRRAGTVAVLGAAIIATQTAILSEVRMEKVTPVVSLVTDRSGSSEACGPAAVKWGFMCSIAARRGDHLYAVDFARPPGIAWDTPTPNEAPIAFHALQKDGTWRSTLLDSPTRTYQTPTLLLGPDGRANVFTLHPGDGTLYWHAAEDPENTRFKRTDIKMGWGAYLGGAIDSKGRALLVYWGNGQPDPGAKGFAAMNSGYRRSTIGYTLVDTKTGKTKNGSIDAPGAPYCYSQVAFDGKGGAHVFTIRSEVKETILCGSRNHYTELHYYYTPDPASGRPWKCVTVYQNPRACIQPLGIEIDRHNRAHLLYYYTEEDFAGKIAPHRLFYAVSKQPVSAQATPEFVRHELKTGSDGRLFQTRNGSLYVLTYRTGTAAELMQILNGPEGRFSRWTSFEMPVSQCRIFPISVRGGSTVGSDLEGAFIGAPNAPERSSIFHFRVPVSSAKAAARL